MCEISQYRRGVSANTDDWQRYIDLIKKGDTKYLKKEKLFQEMRTQEAMVEIGFVRARDIFKKLIDDFVEEKLKTYNQTKQTAIELLDELDNS